MSPALITLRTQIVAIERERAARGFLGGALVSRRSRAKHQAVEALIAAGQAERKAWAAVNEMQLEAERAARQCEMNLGAA